MLAARISLTLSRHSSLSFIALGRSSGQHPVSSHSCWMYVRAGRPTFARPCVGIHKSTSLMSSSLLEKQRLLLLLPILLLLLLLLLIPLWKITRGRWCEKHTSCWVGFVAMLHGISTIVGYVMLNPINGFDLKMNILCAKNSNTCYVEVNSFKYFFIVCTLLNDC